MINKAFNINRVHRNLLALIERHKDTPNPDILKQYTGWGGLRGAVFTPKIYGDLKKTCSDREICSIKKSMINAYYTPPVLIQFIYDALALLERPFKTVLEPSAGHGLFFEYMPTEIKTGNNLFAVEIDEISCKMLQCLYPNIHAYHGGFETYQPTMKFDLIIGNPPYGRDVLNDEQHTDLSELRIHHYFVAKSMRLLEPGGILAMVLPRYFMDNRRNHAREIIHKEGGSLLAAYRFPDNLFSDAKVTVDVVFLIKEIGQDDWLFHEKVVVDGQTAAINRYFSLNPGHILGDLKMVEAYGRPELTCRQNKALDMKAALQACLHAFPPRKMLSIDGFKATLEERLVFIDKQLQALSLMKRQITQAKLDIQVMEQEFLKQCFKKIPLDIPFN